MKPVRSAAAAVLTASAISLIAFASTAMAGPPPVERVSVAPGFAGYNSTVTAITPPDSNGVRYVGGNFTRFNEVATGASMVTDASTGAIDKKFPRVEGDPGQSSKVNAALADGSGGYYIGGDFTKVDGQSMSYAAHINADGSLDTSWNAHVDGEVLAIARSGSTIYLGGRFWNASDEAHQSLAAVDATTGAINSSWAPSADGSVYTIAIDGSTIYVGGEFGKIGASTRKGVAAIGTDGTLKSWTADISDYGRVDSIVVSGSTLYIGGTFTTIGGQSRKNAAAVGTNGTVASWNPGPDAEVQSVVVDGSTVYLGGWFSKVASTKRMGLAAVGTNGTLSSWNPNITDANNYGVSSMAIIGSNLHFGGMFHEVAGTERNDVAAVKLSDASLVGWNPDVDHRQGDVNVVTAVGSQVLVGGAFETAGGTPRLHLAAIDANGDLTSWNPGIQELDPTDSNYPNDYVNSLLLDGSTIYVSGTLDGTVGGVNRPRLAAIGTDGQVITAFNPPAIVGSPKGLVKAGGTLYMGGVTSLGGSARTQLAAVDATTGAAKTWAPYVSSGVGALASDGTTIYVGGSFDKAGSSGSFPYQASTRNRAAAFDSSGALQSWDPNVSISGYSGGVYALAAVGTTIYMGGEFRGVKNITRNNVAAISTSGTLQSWNPNANGLVNSISVAGSNVFLAGGFTTVGGTNHVYVAAVGSNGTVKTWDPQVDQGAYYQSALAASGDSSKVAVAGGFASIAGHAVAGWMFVDAPPSPPADPIITGAPTGTTKQTGASISFTSDAGATFKCSVDGAAYADCTSPKSLSGLSDGSHSLAVKALKGGGESGVSTVSWSVDATAPSAPVVTRTSPASTPTKQSTATIAYSGEAGATFTCSTNGVNYSACGASPVLVERLTEGTKTYYVKATDAAGNTSAAGSTSWVVDLTAPAVPVLSGAPSAASKLKNVAIGFTDEPGATFICSVDNAPYAPCTSPKSFTNLAEGAHQLKVKATDAAGNTGLPVILQWVVDTVAPEAPVIKGVSPLPTSSTSVALTFDRESGATVRCAIDGGIAADCSNGLSASKLAIGTHRVVANATDGAGNRSSSVSAAWVIVAPVPAPVTPTGAVKVSYTPTAWAVKMSPVFGTGKGATEQEDIVSVQFSTDIIKPSNNQPIPTKPTFADMIEAYKSTINVIYKSRPTWVRVGNRAGKWSGWVQINVG